jgi:NAD(P)-dependent dehydrogenase (short-subunit alcohol dehydrogenase family)
MSAAISLAGKVALVTGGGRGIGKSIAKYLARAGANVVIASRKRENLEAAAAELASLPGRVIPIPCHVGRADQLQDLVRQIEEGVGPIDIVVNNSGTNVGIGSSLDVTEESFDKLIEINVKAAWRLLKLTVPRMIERGTGGSIINIASISGLMPEPNGMSYSFTKAGLIMLTKCWSREFGVHRIRVNAIAPGLIQTDLAAYHWQNEARLNAIQRSMSLKHLGQPDEIGFLALYLASDEASYVTGQTWVVDGGLLPGGLQP